MFVARLFRYFQDDHPVSLWIEIISLAAFLSILSKDVADLGCLSGVGILLTSPSELERLA